MISHRSPLGSAGFRLNTLRRLTPDLIPPPPLRGGRGRSLFRFSLRLAGRSRGGGLGPAKGQATTRPSLPPGAAPETGSPPRRGLASFYNEIRHWEFRRGWPIRRPGREWTHAAPARGDASRR